MTDTVKPDEKIEQYWYAIKNVFVMIIDKFADTKQFIKIDKWSNILNELQKQERYEEIEQIIEYLLKKVFMIVMKKNDSLLFGYLYKQHERWNKTNLIGLEKKHADHRIFKNDEHLYVEILVKITHVLYCNIKKNRDLINNIFENINIKIKFNKDQDKIITGIIQKLVDHQKSGCLDIVLEFVNKAAIIKKMYDIDITSGKGRKTTTCKGKHLIQLIKTKQDEWT